MKNIIYLFILGALLTACGGEVNEAEQKRVLLEEKKEALKTLETEIKDLKEELLVLDPPKEKAAVLVKTEIASPESFTRLTEVQASLMSDDMVFASSEMGGRLIKLNVKEGQYVKKGALIARVDMQTMQDQKAELETSLELAKDVYERQERLWEQKVGTEIQYLQAKNNYERLKKSLDLLNNQLGKANVYSPISGVVDKEFLQAGEVAAPGAPIVQLFNPSQLKIVADVPESYLGKIKVGERVKVNFPALGEEVMRRVSLVGRTIDPSNRTFKVELNTGSMGGRLKPNLLAEISFTDFSQDDAIVVDLPLVQEEVSGNKYVYLLTQKDGKTVASKAYVTLGESGVGEAIITSGISEGDKIITDGARSVSEGALVKELNQ